MSVFSFMAEKKKGKLEISTTALYSFHFPKCKGSPSIRYVDRFRIMVYYPWRIPQKIVLPAHTNIVTLSWFAKCHHAWPLTSSSYEGTCPRLGTTLMSPDMRLSGTPSLSVSEDPAARLGAKPLPVQGLSFRCLTPSTLTAGTSPDPSLWTLQGHPGLKPPCSLALQHL